LSSTVCNSLFAEGIASYDKMELSDANLSYRIDIISIMNILLKIPIVFQSEFFRVLGAKRSVSVFGVM